MPVTKPAAATYAPVFNDKRKPPAGITFPGSPNASLPGTGTVPGGLGGSIDNVYQQPGQPTYGPGGTVPGGYQSPSLQMPQMPYNPLQMYGGFGSPSPMGAGSGTILGGFGGTIDNASQTNMLPQAGFTRRQYRPLPRYYYYA